MTLSRGGADEIWHCRPKIVYLQSVIQTAARLVSRHWKWTSVSKEMSNKFHWLHNLGKVEFKCCTIYNTTYSSVWCLHNNELQYSLELLIHTSHYAPGTLSFSIVCIQWSVPLFVLQFHKDHRHTWIFMPAWNNLHPVSMDPLLSFEHSLKTKLFVWTRTQLECAFVRLVLIGVFAMSVYNTYSGR